MAILIGSLFDLEPDFAADRSRQVAGLALILGDGKRSAALVARELPSGRPVGMVTVQLLASTAQGGWSGLVEDMVVESGFRGQGLGRALMAAAEAWCKERGATRIQLLVDEENAPALAFYESLGVRATRMVCRRKILEGDD